MYLLIVFCGIQPTSFSVHITMCRCTPSRHPYFTDLFFYGSAAVRLDITQPDPQMHKDYGGLRKSKYSFRPRPECSTAFEHSSTSCYAHLETRETGGRAGPNSLLLRLRPSPYLTSHLLPSAS